MNKRSIDDLIISEYSSQNGVYPILDGIIDVKLYDNAPVKILWMLWEPYDDYSATAGQNSPCQIGFYNKQNYKPGMGGWDCRADIVEKIDQYKKVKTWNRIIQISSDIMGSSESNPDIIFKSLAFLNISKYPASHTSSNRWNLLEETYKRCKVSLLKQIEFIRPDIVIGGNCLYLIKEEFKFLKIENITTFGRPVYRLNNQIFIDALHPSRKGQKYCDEITSAIKKAVVAN